MQSPVARGGLIAATTLILTETIIQDRDSGKQAAAKLHPAVKHYGGNTALDNFSLSIQSGEAERRDPVP